MSAASLEASINEVFSDSAEPTGGIIAPIAEDQRTLMAAMWEKGIPRTARYSIIEKFEIALTLLRKPQLDCGWILCERQCEAAL